MMTVTKRHKPSHDHAGDQLSVEQLNAVDLLVVGKPDREVAEAVGVARETVTRWRNENPHFQAELNRRRREVWGDAKDRLRALVPKAVDTLEKALDEGNVRAAVAVLKAVRLYGEIGPPSGPEDPELVLWRQAEEWAKAEHAKRPPTGDLVADVFGDSAEVAALTRKRMAELRGTHRV